MIVIKATECGPSFSRRMSSRLTRSLAHTHKIVCVTIVFVLLLFLHFAIHVTIFVSLSFGNATTVLNFLARKSIIFLFIVISYIPSHFSRSLLTIFSASIFHPSMITDKPRNYFMFLALCHSIECLQRDIEDLYLVPFLHYALHSILS